MTSGVGLTVTSPISMGWGWVLGFDRYGGSWRLQRRLLHEHAHIGAVPKYQGIQLRSTRKFLKSLMKDNDVAGLVRAFVVLVSFTQLPTYQYTFGQTVCRDHYGYNVSLSFSM
jgi:hypothetical protein